MSFIAVSCHGFPDYSARLIRQLIEDFEGRVEVVATRPNVPIEGMEQSLGQKVHWVEANEASASWDALGLPVPDLLLLGGYFAPAFRALARATRKAGGKVVLGSDNNWQGGLRQRIVDPVRHRLLLRHRFDAVMTAGRSGIRYSAAMGYARDKIVPGMYGADPALFTNGPPLAQRAKRFVFVGQLIDRKNVLALAQAFAQFSVQFPEWTLDLVGSGPQRDLVAPHPNLRVLDFVQPPQLALMLAQARALVLPSKEEHWGVVVHEAALAGCMLALSNAVGAADDFATPQNAVLFAPSDTAAMCDALCRIASMGPQQLQKAQQQSLRLASRFGPQRFSDELRGLARKLGVC